MSERMFADVVEPGVTIGHRHWYTLPLSIAAHTAILAVIVIIPLMAADVLPAPNAVIVFAASTPLPSPPPPPPPAVQRQVLKAVEPASIDTVPTEAPSGITAEHEIERGPGDVAGIESLSGLVPGDIGTVASLSLPVPPPAPEPKKAAPIGGDIKPPVKIKDVKPIYPQVALASRVQGLVIIAATIGPTGKVEDARILRSSALLDAAALEAVRQWEFTPTLLNGSPVSVVMTVTVNFSLQ